MTDGQLTGTAIREHRQRLRMRQSDLAKQVGISASYFNQIEHNRRRIGGKLLSDIANALGVTLAVLAEGADIRLIEALRDAQANEQGVRGDFGAPEGFAGRYPAWARLLVARHRRVQNLELLVETLTDRLAHDSQLGDALHELLSTVTAIRSSASILVDDPELEPAWRDRFQRNIIEDSARLAKGAQVLVDYLGVDTTTPAGATTPRDEFDQFLDDNSHHFATLEKSGSAAISDLVEKGTALKSAQSRAIAKDYLQTYVRIAKQLPLARMTEAISRLGPDPLAISAESGAPLPVVLQRMACLPLPYGIAVCDLSGTMILRKQTEGFSLPRHGGACALLPLFEALTQPLRPLRQILQQSGRDRGTVLTYSVAAPLAPFGLDGNGGLRAYMLIIPTSTAPALPDPMPNPREVGLTCRICAVADCLSRREPSLQARGSGPR
jgi:XRE family transcriptional regulator, fatty acid utilization regulator